MGAIVVAIIGIYLFIIGRSQQGRLYNAVDDMMGEQVAGFLFSALGGGLIFTGVIWLMLSAIT